MKLSWLFVIVLLAFVALFSVQNAEVVTVRFMVWQFQMSSALVIQLAALLGAFVGLLIGTLSARESRKVAVPAEASTPQTFVRPTLVNPDAPRDGIAPAHPALTKPPE